jgi:hypothetical protein
MSPFKKPECTCNTTRGSFSCPVHDAPRPFVAFGTGFSGDYDTSEEAQAVVDRHTTGVVYVLRAAFDLQRDALEQIASGCPDPVAIALGALDSGYRAGETIWCVTCADQDKRSHAVAINELRRPVCAEHAREGSADDKAGL